MTKPDKINKKLARTLRAHERNKLYHSQLSAILLSGDYMQLVPARSSSRYQEVHQRNLQRKRHLEANLAEVKLVMKNTEASLQRMGVRGL